MNAKHSAILLTGLLLLMIGIAWAQSSNTASPTCPALEDKTLQEMLQPTAWVRANWNMNASQWEIVCTEIDAVANMALPSGYYNTNATMNAVVPARGRHSNSNYVNRDPYRSNYNTAANMAVNAAANMAVNAKPARSVKREPSTRRPSN